MLVLGRIAATHVTAGPAKAQVDPGVSQLEALLATSGLRFDVLHLAYMRTDNGHKFSKSSARPAEWQAHLKASVAGFGFQPDIGACFCVMRRTISRPRPVPSPTPLVVKKGSKIFSR